MILLQGFYLFQSVVYSLGALRSDSQSSELLDVMDLDPSAQLVNQDTLPDSMIDESREFNGSCHLTIPPPEVIHQGSGLLCPGGRGGLY